MSKNQTRIVIGVVALAIIVTGYLFRDTFSLAALAEQESQLREFQKTSPVLVFVIAFVLYVAVTGLSLPGAAVLSLLYAWYFGFWKSILLISFASTAGATVAFLLSRYLFRDAIQNRFGERLKTFNRNLEKDGPFYLFSLRLIPAIPFFVINVVMGLTPMKTLTFWWVSQLGMLPGTIVFTYAGSSVPELQQLAEQGVSGILSTQVIVAFVLLGLFPLLVKKALSFFQKVPPDDSAESAGE